MARYEKVKQSKTTSSNNMITYAIVVVAYIVCTDFNGHRTYVQSSERTFGSLCVYVIMAVSLNLTVGILGELSLGHAGFMCVGAFSSALFSKCMSRILLDSQMVSLALQWSSEQL